MAIESDSLILVMLRRIDANVAEMREDIRELKVPVTHAQEGLAGVNRRIDRMELRLDRIERRLDLVDHPV
jgi:predicted nuclease with TOPRIM domain